MVQSPQLHTCFLILQVDFILKEDIVPDDLTPTPAIGVYLDWLEAMVCLAVPPKTISWEQAEEMTKGMS